MIESLEQEIIKRYVPGETSLREVAKALNTNHKLVRRALDKHNLYVKRKKKEPLLKNLFNRSKQENRTLHNMQTHIRFDVSVEWLSQFDDIEKLKVLNRAITNRADNHMCRFDVSTEWYKEYILKFYYDTQFNRLYSMWLEYDCKPYLKPSLDHIVPRSKGGPNELDNLQFLTWFENRCKNNMSQSEWDDIKTNIGLYLI